MYFAFIDESGTATPNERLPFVLSALLVNEKKLAIAENLLENLRHKYGLPPRVEFHTSDIVHGKGNFRDIRDFRKRERIINDIYTVLEEVSPRIVSVVVHKTPSLTPVGSISEESIRIEKVAYTYLIERILIAFDKLRERDEYLLLIVDETTYKKDRIRTELIGHEITQGIFTSRWSVSAYTIPRPLFLQSSSHSMLQLTDFVSYTIFKIKSSNPISAGIDFTNYYLNIKTNMLDKCRDGRVEGCGLKEVYV